MKEKEREKTICPKCGIPYEEHTCYFVKCSGCPDGHSSFHKTVIESPQWKLWQEEQEKLMVKHYKKKSKIYAGLYDIAECMERGLISQEHFQKFLRFIKNKI